MTPAGIRYAVEAVKAGRTIQQILLTGGANIAAEQIDLIALYRWDRPVYVHAIMSASGRPDQSVILDPEAIQAFVFASAPHQET